MRLDISIQDGLMLIDDAYNANSLSMAAALEILAGAAGGSRKAAVLGDMRELGPLEVAAHEQLGREAAATGLDLLVCLGPAASSHTARAAVEAGMPPDGVLVADDHAQAAELALDWLKPGDALLVKGSRGMAMEQIVAAVRRGWSLR
jgi:UDP-N-acetylmuramoyl-tripeptide--D-alanyl-D-alanine ligase